MFFLIFYHEFSQWKGAVNFSIASLGIAIPNDAKRKKPFSLSKGNGALPDLSIAYRYQGQIMICCSTSRHFPSKQKSIVILLYYYDTIFAIYCKIYFTSVQNKAPAVFATLVPAQNRTF